jgi:hypothetical protein
MVIGLGVESRPMGSIVRRGRNWSDTGGHFILNPRAFTTNEREERERHRKTSTINN